jgi:hypothetical protein
MTPTSLHVLRAVVGLVALSAFVAIWGGWVGLGEMAGFGVVDLAPGSPRPIRINLAITLPLGIEAYAAIALYVAVSGIVTGGARAFAWFSAVGALGIGAFGQAAYHLLAAEEHGSKAPPEIVVFVSVLPVAVLGLASVLLHLAEKAVKAVPILPEDVPGVPEDDGTAPDPWDVTPRDVPEPSPDVPSDTLWAPDADPAAADFYAAAAADPDGRGTLRHGRAALVPQERHSGTAAEEGTRLVPHGGPDRSREQVDGDRETAHDLIAWGHQRGLPITSPALAARHGMSDRWWRDRLAEQRGVTAGR